MIEREGESHLRQGSINVNLDWEGAARFPESETRSNQATRMCTAGLTTELLPLPDNVPPQTRSTKRNQLRRVDRTSLSWLP